MTQWFVTSTYQSIIFSLVADPNPNPNPTADWLCDGHSHRPPLLKMLAGLTHDYRLNGPESKKLTKLNDPPPASLHLLSSVTCLHSVWMVDGLAFL